MLAPLAYRVRPQKLEEVIGQRHLVGENGFLTRCVENDTIVSIIFYGPPGTGKTTIAEAFAKSLNVHYIKLNAVTSNKKDIENAIEESKLYEKSIIIMDEVHRLNKDKQDLLLPHIEDGTIFLLGATTANPYIAINPAIRSRTHLLEVKPLTNEDVFEGIKRAIKDINGYSNKIKINDDAIMSIAKLSGGDMRFALNFLEVLTLSSSKKDITKDDVYEISRVPNHIMDKDDDAHYDSVSALQKSIRGSDVDAALYYLARLLITNDIDSVARRLLVIAYEDVGLANPAAVQRCATAIESAKQLGLPEAIKPLGFSVCDLALSPKSRASCEGIESAMKFAEEKPLDVLDYLRFKPVNVKEEDKYPYDRPELWEKIQYLPTLIKDMHFYNPSNNSSYERALNENYSRLKKIKRRSDLSNLKKETKK